MAKSNKKEYRITTSPKAHWIMTCIDPDYEFAAYHVIFSGWSKPRQKYHVIREDGEYGDSEYLGLMSMDQIIDKYNITEVIPKLTAKDIAKMAKETPNNQDLGEKIRSEVFNLNLIK